MGRRLPSMKALCAFEASARHLSFTKTAEELNVTQAAISHRVRTLEEGLNVQLFRRFNRRLELTDAGRLYLQLIRKALSMIGTAADRASELETLGPVRVSAVISFANKWLLPRLKEFKRQYPETDVLVTADDTLVDLGRDAFDMSIRYGRGRYLDVRVDLLMKDQFIPVCSPTLLDGPYPLRTPADLRHHTLLHDLASSDENRPGWAHWIELTGVAGIDPFLGPGFNLWGMLIDAAVASQGVALAPIALAECDIKAGRLIQPFGPALPSDDAYWVVSNRDAVDRADVRIFRDWLMSEAAGMLANS